MSSTSTQTATKTQLKTPSMWKVVLHNDDFTPMDFVVAILMAVFRKSEEEASAIMITVHEEGKCAVGLYTREIAETKVSQVMGAATDSGHPLKATAEEA